MSKRSVPMAAETPDDIVQLAARVAADDADKDVEILAAEDSELSPRGEI